MSLCSIVNIMAICRLAFAIQNFRVKYVSVISKGSILILAFHLLLVYPICTLVGHFLKGYPVIESFAFALSSYLSFVSFISIYPYSWAEDRFYFMEQKRNQLLDVAKGVAIILVVWGHALQQYSGLDNHTALNSWVERFLISFHMPLFMLISGYLFYFSLQRHTESEIVKGGLGCLPCLF